MGQFSRYSDVACCLAALVRSHEMPVVTPSPCDSGAKVPQTFPKAPWRAVHKGADMIQQVGCCTRIPDQRSLNSSLASACGVDSLGPGCSCSEERTPLECAVSAVWAHCHPAVAPGREPLPATLSMEKGTSVGSHTFYVRFPSAS